ncbi:MAG: type II toxin-antitoxin system VapC family toxin [Akkermansiaceae bacterium]
MTLLLDTCTFIWLCSDPEKLSGPAAEALDGPANDRALSTASVWEISLKYESGKLPLPDRPALWVEEQLRLQDVDVLPLQRDTLYRAAALPPVHKDPFDRVIAADALQRDLRVITPDEPFKLYRCRVVW